MANGTRGFERPGNRHHGVRAGLLVVLGLSVACGGRSASPTAPRTDTSAPNAPPVVKSVTVDRHHIDAGDTITLSATVEDAETGPGALEYLWAAQPPAGTFQANGSIARWTAPTGIAVPAIYGFTVTVVERYASVDASGRSTWLEHRVTGTSPSIVVNDARRETREHADAFLQEFSNGAVPPEMCTRNFAVSCGGRQAAVQQILEHRAAYTDVSTTFDLQIYVRSVEWPNCTAADGAARCALLIYRLERVGTRRADGVRERTIGEQQVRAVYEGNRWWLCDQRFTPTSTVVQ